MVEQDCKCNVLILFWHFTELCRSVHFYVQGLTFTSREIARSTSLAATGSIMCQLEINHGIDDSASVRLGSGGRLYIRGCVCVIRVIYRTARDG